MTNFFPLASYVGIEMYYIWTSETAHLQGSRRTDSNRRPLHYEGSQGSLRHGRLQAKDGQQSTRKDAASRQLLPAGFLREAAA